MTADGRRSGAPTAPATFVVLFAVGLTALVWTRFAAGLFFTDEAIYFLTAHSFAERQSLDIWNGLSETASPLLRFSGLTTLVQNRLIGQYPPFHAVLAAPFYLLFGFRGFFLLNGLCFFLSMPLLYVAVVRVFGDRRLGIAAVVHYALFTYVLDFAVALWPHMLALCLVLASIALAVGPGTRRWALWAAGFLSGIAVGVRYQEIIFTGVVCLHLGARRDWGRLTAFAAGAAPPLIALAVLNRVLLGAASLGYPDLTFFFGGYGYGYVPLLALVAWTAHRAHPALAAATSPRAAVGVCVTALVCLLALFFALDAGWIGKLWTSLRVLYAEMVDMQTFPAIEVPSGKKSLLQASPALVLGLWGAARRLRSPRADDVALFAACAVAEPLCLSAAVHQHGESTPNMRFFLESLPFLAALGVLELRDWPVWATVRAAAGCAGLFAATMALFLFVQPLTRVAASSRGFPLAVLVGVAGALLLRRRVRLAGPAGAGALAIAGAYTLAVGVVMLTASHEFRSRWREVAEEMCRRLPGESMILYGRTGHLVPAAQTRLCGRSRLALVGPDQAEEGARLIASTLARRIPVFLIEDDANPPWSRFVVAMRSAHRSAQLVEPDVRLTRLDPE